MLTKIKIGDIMSDKVAAIVGSWRFILIQSTIITFWIIFNTQIPESGLIMKGFMLKAWDPYPFIFLNLTLSFQAAYTAPIIMMSQNRQSVIDRQNAELDYEVNRQAKADVEHIKKELTNIHNKILLHMDIKDNLEEMAEDIKDLSKIINHE